MSYYDSETRFGSIAVGVLLASVCELSSRAATPKCIGSNISFATGGLSISAGAILSSQYSLFREVITFSLVSAGCVPLISAIVFGTKCSILQIIANNGIIVWIGKLRYSLYVWHIGVAFVFQKLNISNSSHMGRAMLEIIVVFIVASLSYYLIERPLIRISHKPKITPSGLVSPALWKIPIAGRACAAASFL